MNRVVVDGTAIHALRYINVCNTQVLPQAVDPKCFPRVHTSGAPMQEVVSHGHLLFKDFERKPE